jgi:replication factor A1
MSTYDDNESEQIKVGDLSPYSRRVYTVVKVISKTEPREVTSRNDNSTHMVGEALVGDETGTVYMTLWDESLDEITEDMVLNVKDAYINLFKGSMRLSLGRYGSYDVLDEAPFDEVNLDNNLSSKVYDRPRQGRRDRYGRSNRRY